MKSRFLPAFAIALSFSFSLAFSGCGGSGPDQTLTVTPAGPTIVMKGDTLLLTANLAGVAWSVQGGDGNGTIDGNGLYTPPAQIPTASPRITVMAESNDGQVATALIDLRAGVELVFNTSTQVNDGPVSTGIFSDELQFVLESDRLAVRLGSVQEDSIFSSDNGGRGNVFFSQELDFAGFSAPANLSNTTSVDQYATAIETDSALNPGILFIDVPGGALAERLFFSGSDDGGESFNAPVPISTANPNNSHSTGFMRMDAQDAIHVAFAERDLLILDSSKIYYVQSNNGGADWTPPEPIDDAATVQIRPSIAVDPTGQTVLVCWTESGTSENGTIQFARSVDGGATFSDPISLSDSNRSNNCRVARGPTGQVYVSFIEDNNDDGVYNLFLTASADAQSFNDPVQVNSGPITTFVAAPAFLAVDSLGRIDLVWTADPDASMDFNVLNYSRSINGGGAFSPQQTLDSGPSGNLTTGSALIPTGLKHDAADRLYVQYFKGAIETTAGTGNILILRGE